MPPLLNIVYEDDDLLVVNKPADLVCHPTKAGPLSSLVSRARLHLGEAASAPQLINRLDRETSGLVLLAKNPTAARQLRVLWERRLVRKSYLAIVHGRVQEPSGLIDAPLGKDEHSPVAIKDCVRPDGAAAQTAFQRLLIFTRPEGDFSFVRLEPLTGRKHQLRIHLAHLGYPIVGDKLYGEDESLYLALVRGVLTAQDRKRLLLPCHALHAAELRFHWPDRDWRFTAEPETWFLGFLPHLVQEDGFVAQL